MCPSIAWGKSQFVMGSPCLANRKQWSVRTRLPNVTKYYWCSVIPFAADFELAQLQEKLKETEEVMERIVSQASPSPLRYVVLFLSLSSGDPLPHTLIKSCITWIPSSLARLQKD